MSEALARFVAEVKPTLPRSGTQFQFRAVYDTWATFNKRAMSSGGQLPAAVVLPDRPVYEDSALAPRMIEDTWSGGDPNDLREDGSPRYPIGDDSGDGFALFTLAELVVPFVLLLRTKTISQRKAFVKRLEEVFIEDGALLPDKSSLDPQVPVLDAFAQPIRYGRILTMKSYYDRKVRFTLQAQQLLDSETTAMENRWLAQFELTGHAQVCVLRRVRAMKPVVQIVVDGTIDQRT